MRFFRLFLFVLLSLAIPAHAYAAVGSAPAQPCPMQAGVAKGAVLRAADSGQRQPDCCNDADTAAKTGKLCKAGQECKAGPLAPAYAAGETPLALPAPQFDPRRMAAVPLAQRARIWRPPSRV